MPFINHKNYTVEECIDLFSPIVNQGWFAAKNARQHLLHAFFSKHPKSDCTHLFNWCKSNRDHTFQHVWEFEVLSGEIDIVRNVINLPNAGALKCDHKSIADYAAHSGNANCLFAILDAFPTLKYTSIFSDYSLRHYAAMSNNAGCVKALLLRYPEFIYQIINNYSYKDHYRVSDYEGDEIVSLSTKLNLSDIVREVKLELEQRDKKAELNSLYDANKASTPQAATSATTLTDDAQTHIQEVVKSEIEKLTDSGVDIEIVTTLLNLLADYPFDTKTVNGREQDKKVLGIIANNDFDLIYYMQDPQTMSKSIEAHQVKPALTFLKKCIAQETLKLEKQIETSKNKTRSTHTNQPERRTTQARTSNIGVFSDSAATIDQLAVSPAPPKDEPKVEERKRAALHN